MFRAETSRYYYFFWVGFHRRNINATAPVAQLRRGPKKCQPSALHPAGIIRLREINVGKLML